MRRMPLTYQIFIGMVVGLIVGAIVGPQVATQWLEPFGDIFIRLIQMLVVPLVFIEANTVILKLVMVVMAYAPVGVAALMAWVAGAYGFSILVPLAKYLVGVIVGVFLHGAVIYGIIVAAIGGVNPWRFYQNAVDFMLVAFSTCSSGATLPLNMEVAETKMGVKREIFGFTLPLGATINMDGTAIYMGVATVLIAQFYGIALAASQQFAVILTATVASIGGRACPAQG